MNKADRWLLPDGIEEMLPEEALKLETLRRDLVDGFRRWGYDYVIPPLVEYTDSLFTGSGKDVDLHTFKITDQLTGKTMGVRADITPQAARMDAHSMHREGVNRLCYAGHVLHTRSKNLLGSRAPIQLGVELFGVAGLEADIEVVSLLIESLQAAGSSKVYLDLGHVAIYRSLVKAANFTKEQELSCFELLQSKSMTELEQWLNREVADEQVRAWMFALPSLAGSKKILEKAQKVFEGAPQELQDALETMTVLADALHQRYPEVQLYFDLSELRGYHYHTGLVFGAFAPGLGEAIANGGRYDRIGEAFGNSRPATGFNIDLIAVARSVERSQQRPGGIFSPLDNNPRRWQKVCELRRQGKRVVCGIENQSRPFSYQNCDRLLQNIDGEYQETDLQN